MVGEEAALHFGGEKPIRLWFLPSLIIVQINNRPKSQQPFVASLWPSTVLERGMRRLCTGTGCLGCVTLWIRDMKRSSFEPPQTWVWQGHYIVGGHSVTPLMDTCLPHLVVAQSTARGAWGQLSRRKQWVACHSLLSSPLPISSAGLRLPWKQHSILYEYIFLRQEEIGRCLGSEINGSGALSLS